MSWFIGLVHDGARGGPRPRASGSWPRRRSRSATWPWRGTGPLVPRPRLEPRRGPGQQVPGRAAGDLTAYVRDREGYDYRHHAEVGSDERRVRHRRGRGPLLVVGDAAEHIAKLRELADAGVDQFNIYLMNGDEEEQLEIYGREIIPALRDVPAARA